MVRRHAVQRLCVIIIVRGCSNILCGRSISVREEGEKKETDHNGRCSACTMHNCPSLYEA
ncbi:hypothetical protein BC629DRAFT_1525493 [Irpex lacteus]|nr:hypothetical protein BC629DRAFT_1525493 [Irpex lacteus]